MITLFSLKQSTLTSVQSPLPLLVVLLSKTELLSNLAGLPYHNPRDDAAKTEHGPPNMQSSASRYSILAIATLSAGAALAIYSVPSTIALGLSSAIFTATGLVLLEAVIWSVEDDSTTGTYSAIDPDGVRARRNSSTEPSKEQRLVILRDFAAALTVSCCLASILVEPNLIKASWQPSLKAFGSLQRICWIVPVQLCANAFFYFIVSCVVFVRWSTSTAHLLMIYTPNSAVKTA